MGTKHTNTQTKNHLTAEEQAERQVIREHLRAFINHFLWLSGSFVVAAIIGFEFKDIIESLLVSQLTDLSLMNLIPAREFPSTVMVCLYTGALVALPLVGYHTYRFLEPLFERGNSYAARLLSTSAITCTAAVAYAFMVTIPVALHGMVGAGQDATFAHVSTESFLAFVITNSLVVVALFQLPLALLFINSLGSLTHRRITLLQRIGLPTIALLAIIATPFTALNRFAMGVALIAVPSIVLFEGALLRARRKAKHTPASVAAVSQAEPEVEEDEIVAQQPVQQAVPVRMPSTSSDDELPMGLLDSLLQDTRTLDDEDTRFELPPSLEVVSDDVPVQQVRTQYQPRPVITRKSTVAGTHYAAPPVPATLPSRQTLRPRPFTPVTTAVPPVQPQRQIVATASHGTPLRVSHSLRSQQPTIPFRMSSVRSREHTIDGMLPA